MNKTWTDGIKNELDFWDDWIEKKGYGSSEYEFRLDPEAELQQEISILINKEYLRDTGMTLPSVLDVGAGPLTFLGKKYNGKIFKLIAIDALAGEYDTILTKHGIIPPNRTIKWDSERIGEIPAYWGRFDLITARNTLDHSYDPVKAILAMPDKLHKGGVIYLQHIVNVGKCEQYKGLHQWNFYLERDDLIISSQDEVFNITEMFKRTHGDCTFEHHMINEVELATIIKLVTNE